MKKLIACCLLAVSAATTTLAYQIRLCSYDCQLAEVYFCLRTEIRSCYRHCGAQDACELVALAQRIAPLFAHKDAHTLSCIVALVFTEYDQILRWAVSKFIPKKDGRALNSLWFMTYNPEIMEMPLEDDYRIVYNALEMFRQAVAQNNLPLQRSLIERLGFYFENRTIDFMAPLMKVAVRADDDLFIELMGFYLRPYEQTAFLVAWEVNKIILRQEAEQEHTAEQQADVAKKAEVKQAIADLEQSAPTVVGA